MAKFIEASHQFRAAHVNLTKAACLLPELILRHKTLAVLHGTAAAELTEVKSISAFEQIEEISQSGNHSVYRATDKNTNVVYAIKKFIKGKDPEERRRFRREAHILASLSHPAIVPLEAIFEVLVFV